MTNPMIAETFLPVRGFAGLYEVSNQGRVRSLDRWTQYRDSQRHVQRRTLRLRSAGIGYLRVELCRNGETNNRYVHHLVLEAFIGPAPKGHECCHWDGDRTNNQIENLRWDSRSGNHADKIRHGTSNRGERHPLAKLTNLDIRCIRHWLADGRWTQRKIADVFEVSRATIGLIKCGKVWGWLR